MAIEKLSRDMYLAAAAARKTFSQYLEELDPTPEGEKLDAFERQLKAQGIVVRSNYEKGIYADNVEAFYRTEESQVLFPEYIARQVREAVVEDTVLPYLIGQNTVITGDVYRSFYVEDQPEKQRKKRVTEASELPRSVIKGKEQTVKIYKFGRAIEASYEVIRRMQIDMLAVHVRRIAIQAAKDKVEEILTVVASGDGNNNAAPVLNLTSLDSGAVAGTLTAKGFLAFAMEFEPFPLNTIVAAKDSFIQLVLTNIPNLTTADLLRLLAQGTVSGVRLTAPQLPNDTIRLFWNADVPSLRLYGINNQYAIEQVTEAGSDIQEADRFITRQTQVLTISENSGFAKIMNEATKILNIAA
jgi:hypothetical protein